LKRIEEDVKRNQGGSCLLTKFEEDGEGREDDQPDHQAGWSRRSRVEEETMNKRSRGTILR
jgi:hypothetical protein